MDVRDFMDEDFEVIEDDDEDDDDLRHEHKKRLRKHRDAVRAFLGRGRQYKAPVLKPDYYGELLCLALSRCIAKHGWKLVRLDGYPGAVPNYVSAATGYGCREEVVSRGTLFLEKEGARLIAVINYINSDIAPAPSLVLTATDERVTGEFAAGVRDLARGETLYKGKNLELGPGTIGFLELPEQNWQDLALDGDKQREIETNTIGYLARMGQLEELGIPGRRGIILAGEPGTGKTLISRILMRQSPGVTCISARSFLLTSPGYIHDLYELAAELAPSMVFMEDIDLVGEDRRRARHATGPALSALLEQMDGARRHRGIVTIATTNFLDDIDDALRKRPSRFDRIVELDLPDREVRLFMVQKLARKISLAEDIQEYLAAEAAGFTPAQIQEAVYSLAIEHICGQKSGDGLCACSRQEVDDILRKVKRDRDRRTLGFAAGEACRRGEGMGAVHIYNNESREG